MLEGWEVVTVVVVVVAIVVVVVSAVIATVVASVDAVTVSCVILVPSRDASLKTIPVSVLLPGPVCSINGTGYGTTRMLDCPGQCVAQKSLQQVFFGFFLHFWQLHLQLYWCSDAEQSLELCRLCLRCARRMTPSLLELSSRG